MQFYVSRARALLLIRASFPHDPDTAEEKAKLILADNPPGLVQEDGEVNIDQLELEIRNAQPLR